MSAHMRKHHTEKDNNNIANLLYIVKDEKTYAIPKKIAEKYLISSNKYSRKSVPAEKVFAKLEQRFTRAGTLLKGTRARENLTQKDFAEKIGITQANLSNMENGKRPIGKIIAKRIEKAFGVDYRYFLE